uniref:Uncharacterized protein n=1 Tax=Pithovirus LCPAC103 TaxID=2506588 RepID=A0A481Z3F6_9VIRU|nr:MAG: uncharacterized protein LCPAC103_00650 [Pithovirus LCPAC103]
MASRSLWTGQSDLIHRPGGWCQVKGIIKIIGYKHIRGTNKICLKPQTYLLSPVIIGGIFYNHLWIEASKPLQKFELGIGDTVIFEAKVRVYERPLDVDASDWKQGKIGLKKPYRDIISHRAQIKISTNPFYPTFQIICNPLNF